MNGIAKGAAQEAVGGLGSMTCKVIGTGCIVVGAVVGVVAGGILTNKYCNELIDKCGNYYKNNYTTVKNSYISAIDFLTKQKNNKFI